MAITSYKPENNRFNVKDGRIQPPNQRFRFFVSLDALLDTRLGLINHEYPERLKDVDIDVYAKRCIDGFSWLSAAEFKAKWEARDDHALTSAYMTGIHFLLLDMLRSAYYDSIEQPFTNRPTLTVSLAPYHFSKEEQDDFQTTLIYQYGQYADVHLCNTTLEELTLQHVKTRYEVLILYEAVKWLGLHEKEFTEKHRLPFVQVFAPRLYQDKIPSQEESMVDGNPVDFFDITEKHLKPVIDISFLRSEIFSICSPAFYEQQAQLVSVPQPDPYDTSHEVDTA